MKLNELKYVEGSRKEHYRKGRGIGSGNGKNCGTGTKGQTKRRQGEVAVGFEGGQTPIWRRLPKRGFSNRGHATFAIVNLDVLNKFEANDVVDMTKLVEAGYVKSELSGLKVLGDGKLTKKLTVKANKFSKSAKAAIEKLEGTAEVI